MANKPATRRKYRINGKPFKSVEPEFIGADAALSSFHPSTGLY
jgi:hypothetical protein